MKLDRNFYLQDTIKIAKELLGCTLVHNIDGKHIRAKITETEAYLGIKDRAAHSFGGKKTPRTQVMYKIGGFSYIYFIYGMYYCFNVVTRDKDEPEAVLIRAVSPLEDSVDAMAENRYQKSWNELSKTQQKNLSNGPGKLTIAFNMDKSCNALDLTQDKIYIESKDQNISQKIYSSKRIGIDYAGDAVDWNLRFYIK